MILEILMRKSFDSDDLENLYQEPLQVWQGGNGWAWTDPLGD